MTRAPLTCLACGYTGHDVTTVLVAYDDPQPVTVEIPVAHRDDAVTVRTEVPGVYGAEWRCRDGAACLARERALAAPAEPDRPRREHP